MKRLTGIAFFAAVALIGCPGTFGTPPIDDPVIVMPSLDGGPEMRGCGVLRALSCPEGANAHCVEALAAAPSSNVSAVNVDCILAANTKAAVRGCGIRCLP